MSGGDDGASIVCHSRSIGLEHLKNSGRIEVSARRGSLRSRDNYRKGRSLGLLFTASVREINSLTRVLTDLPCCIRINALWVP
jgi:hypothetical protein